jgi:hypothetical protein
VPPQSIVGLGAPLLNYLLGYSSDFGDDKFNGSFYDTKQILAALIPYLNTAAFIV